MKIQWISVLKAAGVGLVVYLLLQFLSRTLAASYGISAAPTQAEAMAMLSSPFMAISLGLSCLGLLIDVGVGALYGFFAKHDGLAPDAGTYAIGGGITNVIVSLVGACVGMLFNSGTIANAMQQAQNTPGVDPATMGPIMAVSIVIGLAIGIGISAALGAIGGAIYGSIAKSRAIMNPPAA